MDSLTAFPSVATLVDEVLSGQRSALAVTQESLARIAALDPAIGAFLTVDAHTAVASAQALDARLQAVRADPEALRRVREELPLAGVPVALKDVLSTKGLRTTCGSKILEHYVPPYDATVVSRLRQAGAIVVGKTNMDEFGMGSSTENSAYFPCKNPWDLARVPGGSSGGSAAAVAAGMVPVALGSDTGGSVRQPAAFTGTFGLKPTYGRVSRYGLIAYASSLDVVGHFAQSVPDLLRFYAATAGHDPRDASSPQQAVEVPSLDNAKETLRGLRVGLPTELLSAEDPDPAMEATKARLLAAGATLHPVSVPHIRYAVSAYYLLATAEASSNLARYDGVRFGLRVESPGAKLETMYSATREKGFGPEVKRRILLGTFALSHGYYDAYYAKAQKVRTLIQEDFSRVFSTVDVLLSPTTPGPAFGLGTKVQEPLSMYLADVYTLPASLAGIPALTLPAAMVPNPSGSARRAGLPAARGVAGLPMGVQLLAPAFQEALLLRVAEGLQQAQA